MTLVRAGTWIAAVVASLVWGASAAGQTARLPEGTRVRFVAVGGYRADGALITLSSDSLVLRSDQAGRIGLARGALRRLEAKLPAGSTWQAARLGMLVGAAVSLVTGGALAIAEGGSLDVPFTGALVLGTTGAGALLGAVFLRGYSWQVVPLDRYVADRSLPVGSVQPRR